MVTLINISTKPINMKLIKISYNLFEAFTLIFALCLITLNLNAQETSFPGKAEITGDISSITKGDKKLEITYRMIGGGFQFDSCKVTNGIFSFEKDLQEPIIVIISFFPDKSVNRAQGGVLDYHSFFLIPGKGKITANGSLEKSVFTGSAAKYNEDYEEVNKKENEYFGIRNNITQNLIMPDGTTSVQRQKWITNITDSINLIRDTQLYKSWIDTKPNSIVSAYLLLAYSAQPVWTPRRKMEPENIENLLKKLPISLQKLPALLKLQVELLAAKATMPGKPILNFTLTDTVGRQVSLSDFKGKYIFLDFWASWCAPCRRENPNIVKQFYKYKDRNFTVLSVSMDKPEARQAWLNAIHKDQIGLWTHLCDSKGFSGEVATAYYIKSIPTNFLIDPDGKFVARNLYGDALDKELSKIFSK
jgi:peroxiredoxin